MRSQYEKIKHEIEMHRIISFDIFDTLVFRNVCEPSDIFEIVQYTFLSRNQGANLTCFKEDRIQAEKQARRLYEKEVTLEQIYNELPYDANVKMVLKNIEIEVEELFIVPNLAIRELYEYAKKLNKEIIIISDMYMSRIFIETILEKCGYTLYDDLFLSCEIGKRKRTGELFKHVLECKKCLPREILHIGDNRRSDDIEAKKCGLNTCPIEKATKKLYHYLPSKFNIDKIQNNVVNAVIYNNLSAQKTDAERLGYSILGYPLMGYCQWVHEQTNGLHKFFLARDGYLLMKAYELMFPNEKEYLHYLYISRKALRQPNIYAGIDYVSLVEQFANLQTYTVNDILNFCGVQDKNAKILRNRYKDLKAVRSRVELGLSSDYKKLYEDIREIEKDNFYIQYHNLCTYLKQENFVGKVAVLDVGWRGTAQINLSSICGDNVDIIGYYFGVENSISAINYDYSKLKGYFWNYNQENAVSNCILRGRKAIFESMFLSKTGSTIAYNYDSSRKVVPVFEKVIDESDENIAEFIQKGALQFIDDMIDYIQYIPQFDSIDTTIGLVDFLLYPQKCDLIIGDIISENYNVRYIAKPKAITEYIKNMKLLKEDIKSSEWKVGFICRLFSLNRKAIKCLNLLYEKMRHV